MGTTIQEVVGRLSSAEYFELFDEYRAPCPACEQQPGGSQFSELTIREKDGKVQVECCLGHTASEVARSLGLPADALALGNDVYVVARRALEAKRAGKEFRWPVEYTMPCVDFNATIEASIEHERREDAWNRLLALRGGAR